MHRPLALFFAVLVGCAPAAPVSVVGLSARLGPAGGELAAPEGDALEGARLEVPPGALETEVELTLTPAEDDTPLPEDGFRIGPHFRVEPVATVLKKPVRITYPFDFDTRRLFPNADDECRVWQREGDGWKGHPQVASTDYGVTIETSSFATAAPGVQRIVALNVCVTNPTVCALPGPCTSPTGICMEQLPGFSPRPFSSGSVGVARAKVVYVSKLFDAPVHGAVYEYPTGVTTLSPPLTHPSMGPTVGRPDMTSALEVWGAMVFGSTRFPRVEAPARLDTQSGRQARGVAVSGAGQVFRFVRDLPSGAPGPTYKLVRDNQEFTITSDFPSEPVNFVHRAGVGKFVAWTPKRGLVFFEPQGNQVVQHLVEPPTGFVTADVAASPRSAAFSVLFRAIVGSSRKLAMFTEVPQTRADRTHRRDFDDVQVTSLEYGSDDRVYGFTPTRAQLDVFEFATGGVQNIPLSTAPVTSTEYKRMLPYTLRNVHPTGELLLITQGTSSGTLDGVQVWAIKRAGLP